MDPVRIEFPKGSYAPQFKLVDTGDQEVKKGPRITR